MSLVSAESAESPTAASFAARLRSASRDDHASAHDSTFMTEFLGGRLGLDSYIRYTGQLWHVYRGLEESAGALADDPVAGPFVRPELFRVAALEDDLRYLLGDDWAAACAPIPSVQTYVGRIRQVASSWPGGYVAHHYTRYLGDLSGGQVVRSVAEKTWGLPRKGDGVRFYVFDEIGNPAAFKREYRTWLDALPVDELEAQRIVDECRAAFAYNIAVLNELAEDLPLSA